MTGFTYVETFAGIGGVSFGLDKVGGTCVMASEIDKYATQAYSVLHPNVDIRGDITQIHENDVPDHDLLSFTTPCQSFSVAGKRKGFEDTRGTLVFEALRIAKHKQPKVLFMENVKGLVGHDNGNTLDTIVQAMNDVGYTVDFNVLNSKYFGIPQSRERVFIIAVRDDLVKAEPWDIVGTNVVAKGKRRIRDIEGIKTFNFDWPKQTEVTGRLGDILETEVDEKYYLPDEKTAVLVAKWGKPLPAHFPTIDGINNTIRTGGKGSLTAKHNYEHIAIGKRPNYRIRSLTSLERWRLQGFTDAQHQTVVDAGLSDSQRYKQAGNAVTVNVIHAIGTKLLPYFS